jgi:hypothetical protein
MNSGIMVFTSSALGKRSGGCASCALFATFAQPENRVASATGSPPPDIQNKADGPFASFCQGILEQ